MKYVHYIQTNDREVNAHTLRRLISFFPSAH